MIDPGDPFDDDETSDIIDAAVGEQIAGAFEGAQDEFEAAKVAITQLTIRLGELLPPAAVVNLIASIAVGTALKETYG